MKQEEKQKPSIPRFADASRGESEQNYSEQNPQSPPMSSTAPLQRSPSKIAILHDAFLYRGGGERLVTLMAKILGADLVAGFFSEGSFDPRALGFEGQMIPLGKPVFMKGIRHEILKYRFRFRTKFLSEYDTVIFSGNCLDAVENLAPKTRKIYYCHTPPRYIFDLREDYLAKIPIFLRGIANFFLDRQADRYRYLLGHMDLIITNSINVQNRLKDYTGFHSQIIYPPTDTSRFAPRSMTVGQYESMPEKSSSENSETLKLGNSETLKLENYFLSFARLSPPKRVDMIVDAFLEMPEKNLILTYGKNDPMKDAIFAKIRGRKNILALESPDDNELIDLIQGAIATIYIPVDEDFGMSPVESMACGTPVIGVNEGGLRETIVDGKTGFLIDFSPENLKKSIQNMTLEIAQSLHQECILHVNHFSLQTFECKLLQYLK